LLIYLMTVMQDWLNNVLDLYLPAELKFLSSIRQEDIVAIFEKQQANTVETINYAQLLEDILLLLKKHLKNDIKPLDNDSLIVHQYLNGIGIKSSYYKLIQDSAIDMPIKRATAYFFRNLLQTASSIYGIEMLNRQQEFVIELEKDEERYRILIKQYNELIIAIENDTATEPIKQQLSEYWLHSYEQLCRLSELLEREGFIDNAATFLQSFCNVLQHPCNWTKSKRSFMFLINRISPEAENYKLNLKCDFLSKAFTFKGKATQGRTLRETLRNIEPKTLDDPKFLGGDYAVLDKIYASIFK